MLADPLTVGGYWPCVPGRTPKTWVLGLETVKGTSQRLGCCALGVRCGCVAGLGAGQWAAGVEGDAG